jgi:hypothetical protein
MIEMRLIIADSNMMGSEPTTIVHKKRGRKPKNRDLAPTEAE